MLKKQARILLIGSALLGASFAVWPQASSTGSATVPADRLIDRYTTLAGSESNARSLVTGLRDGTDIKLTSASPSGTATTTIDPPTGKMGVGNVNIALALAQASLKGEGITKPTPQQLQAALNGGTVTDSSGKTVQLSGVLQMRADGKGWGQIAHALGFKLGDVVRSEAADGAGKPDHAGAKPGRVAQADRVERPEKAERAERPERPMKPERAERPGR
jgi:hypothetical protein